MSETRDDKPLANASVASGNMTDDDETFLERWSRRKSQAIHTAQTPEPVPTATLTAAAEKQATPVDETVPEQMADDDTPTGRGAVLPDLPPLESLGEDADYSAFLAPGVGVDLRRKALRQLFHSPKFNIRDGLDDYDLDFSSFAPLGDIVTAEMRHRLLRGLEQLADLAQDGGDDEPAEPLTQLTATHDNIDSLPDEQPTDDDDDNDSADTA